MSEIKAQGHKRITDVLFEHWNEVRGERMFPSKDKIDEFDLQQKGVWDDVFVIEVFPLVQSNGYRFIYTGKNLGNEFNHEDSGQVIKNLIMDFLQSSNDKYNIVAEHKRPFQEEKTYKIDEAGGIIKYRQILLPLGPGDDEPVDVIIGGMRFIRA